MLVVALMDNPPRSSRIAITTEGEVSAVAALSEDERAADLQVWGKLVFALGLDGNLSIVARPESPGYNAGVADISELDASGARRIVVRGKRSLAGRIILRRGPTALAELDFAPGAEPASAKLADAMQTTIAGRRGDEWLVIEGVDSGESRRWCKLPKLGAVATWAAPGSDSVPASVPALETLLLTSRLCLVDVSTWTVVFVLRGARRLLKATVPRSVNVRIRDLGTVVVPPPPASSQPSVRGPHSFVSGPTVTSRRDEALDERFMDDETTSSEKTITNLSGIHDEDSVSRAFAALTVPAAEKPQGPREEKTLLSVVNPAENPAVRHRK